jgi:succinate dehydrogenase / fumarate reductase, cytochrome b subunit
MKWLTQLFNSTLGYKVLMALTGLFLILFLTVHLIGNLQLLKSDGGRAFNVYAEFMSTNALIQTVSKGNFLFIIVHAVWAILLTRRNAKARGPVGYAVKSGKSSHWTSRNMGILGTLILVFIVTHLYHFWAQMHGYWGSVAVVDYDGKPTRDLYTLVDMWFAKEWYVALYVFCMGAIAFHLWHGFASAFQTLGLNHLKYNNLIALVGRAFAIIVPALFALIPIWMYLN